MATSTQVMTARMKPICAYSSAAGCFSKGYASSACSHSREGSMPSRMRYSARVILGPSWLNQVDERKDHDPNDVDEVPIKPGKLDIEAVLLLYTALQGHAEQRKQDQHADRHVGA